MQSKKLVAAAALTGSLAILGACSSSESSPAPSATPEVQNITPESIEGDWNETSSRVTSDGGTDPATGTYSFRKAGESVVEYTMTTTFSNGNTLTWEGLGSVAPNGNLLFTHFGESVVETGYVVDDDTIIIQSVELQETGQDGGQPPVTTFAKTKTLTRQS